MISSNGTNENTAIIWAVSRPVGGDASNPGGFKTHSDVLVAADGYMYFRGTDDKVWRVKAHGTDASNPGVFKTDTDELVPAHGYIDFPGADNKVWPVTRMPTSACQKDIHKTATHSH